MRIDPAADPQQPEHHGPRQPQQGLQRPPQHRVRRAVSEQARARERHVGHRRNGQRGIGLAEALVARPGNQHQRQVSTSRIPRDEHAACRRRAFGPVGQNPAIRRPAVSDAGAPRTLGHEAIVDRQNRDPRRAGKRGRQPPVAPGTAHHEAAAVEIEQPPAGIGARGDDPFRLHAAGVGRDNSHAQVFRRGCRARHAGVEQPPGRGQPLPPRSGQNRLARLFHEPEDLDVLGSAPAGLRRAVFHRAVEIAQVGPLQVKPGDEPAQQQHGRARQEYASNPTDHLFTPISSAAGSGPS